MATIPRQLPYSNPENIVSASPGQIFYRSDDNKFYLQTNGLFVEQFLTKKAFTVNYSDDISFQNLDESLITFEKPRELWIKGGSSTGKTGWIYINNKNIFPELIVPVTSSPTPTPTVTPTPSVTPTITPTPTVTPTPSL